MLRDCLRAVDAAAEGLRTTIYVVDNASSDGSAAMVRSEFPHVLLTESAENLGFVKANNAALARCTGDFVVLLNPDTEALPGSLSRMVEYLQRHPEVGAVGPKLLNTDGSLQRNGMFAPTLFRECVAVFGIRRLFPNWFEDRLTWGRTDFATSCAVEVVSGACITVPGGVLRRLGPLDERFFMYYEEMEWCWRIRRAGLQIHYVADSIVVHHWMGSAKSHMRRMTDTLFRSQVQYYRITQGPAAAAVAVLISTVGRAKNTLLYAGVAVKRVLRRAGLFGGVKL
jgi:GT2 family glycosyltransferase